MPPTRRCTNTMAPHAAHPQRDACSSRRVGIFTEVPAPWRDAHEGDGGNKQGEHRGTQPPSTTFSDPEFTPGAVNRSQ